MTRRSTDDVSRALTEIASWYGPEPAPRSTRSATGTPSTGTEQTAPAPGPLLEPAGRPSSAPSRIGLVVATAAVVLGLIALVLTVVDGGGSTSPAGRGVGPTIGDDVLTRCLDLDSEYDLASVATDGVLHRFDLAEARTLVVLATERVHLLCLIGQRDGGDQFVVFNSVAANSAAPTATQLDLQQLFVADRAYLVGRRGAEVESVTVVGGDDGPVEATLVDRWWAVALDPRSSQLGFVPGVTVTWLDGEGTTASAQADDLFPVSAFSLCRADEACRQERLNDLQARAAALPSDLQATILADGEVTEAEYRRAVRAWGECVAEATGAEVTFDDDGLFTARNTGPGYGDAFESCRHEHASLVIEAAGLG